MNPSPVPPRAAGLVRATVRGGSMRPWLPDGTEVLIRPAGPGAGCRAGDVLLLRLGATWAVHRALRSVPSAGAADRGCSPSRGRPPARRRTHPFRPAPPTRGDWTGVADPPAGAAIGRVVYARIGGRWRRVDTRLARLAGLAASAIVAVVTRVGARRMIAEARGR